MKIKAVLFDLVGTLIYVKDSVGTIYSSVASSFGFNTDYKKLDDSFLKSIHLYPQPTGGEEEEKKWWKRVVLNTFKLAGYDLKDKFDEVFEVLFKEFTKKSSWGVYPDVVGVLEKLQKNEIKTGLISNFDSRLEIILKGLDLHKCFNCLSYSGKVGFSKPDPRIFQHALNELNIIAEEAIYIGDDLDTDYYPACDININAVLIDKKNENKVKGIRTISNLSQVFELVAV